MAYFKRKEVEAAIADLKKNQGSSIEEARSNGWAVEVEPQHGLTTWTKDFGSFVFSQDRGGSWSLSDRNNASETLSQVCQFYSLAQLEREEWIETAQQAAIARP
jgi:hypothetical protein